MTEPTATPASDPGGAESRITITTPEMVMEQAIAKAESERSSLDLDALAGEPGETAEASSTPESGDDEPDEEPGKKPPRGVQKRLDELTREKYEERRRADALQAELQRAMSMLERQQGGPEPSPQTRIPAQTGAPDPAQYPDGELDLSFIRDLTRYEVRQEMESARQAVLHQQAVSEIQGREDAARARYADYDAIVNPENLAPLAANPDLFRTIAAHDQGPELAYYLGRNPQEVLAIAQMSPYQAAMRVGQLLSAITPGEPASKPGPSRAPAPIQPLRGAGSAPAISYEQAQASAIESGDFDRWRAAKRAAQSRGKR